VNLRFFLVGGGRAVCFRAGPPGVLVGRPPGVLAGRPPGGQLVAGLGAWVALNSLRML